METNWGHLDYMLCFLTTILKCSAIFSLNTRVTGEDRYLFLFGFLFRDGIIASL